MPMSRLFPEILKDYARSCVFLLIALAIFGVMAGCLVLTLPLLGALGFSEDALYTYTLLGMTCLAVLLPLGTAATFALLRRRTFASLDNAFQSVGLTGANFMLTGRRYHGNYGGNAGGSSTTGAGSITGRSPGTAPARGTDAVFYRGPALTLYLDTPLQTRFSIGQRDRAGTAIAGVFGRQPLDLPGPDNAGIVAYALDESWTRSLLAHPEAAAILRRLVLGETPFVFQQVHLTPGALHLRLHRLKKFFSFSVEISPEQVRGWLGDLAALAVIAEALPAPTVIDTASSLELRFRGR